MTPAPPREPFVFPSHCGACGVLLMGGATEHLPACPIRLMIEEFFPWHTLPHHARYC